MAANLEQVGNAMDDGQVPALWLAQLCSGPHACTASLHRFVLRLCLDVAGGNVSRS